MKTTLERMRLKVPMRHVQGVRRAWGDHGQKALLRDIQTRLELSGNRDVLAVIQDPTDNTSFTAIARPSSQTVRTPLISIVSRQHVEEPSLPQVGRRVLDPGLTDDELETVRTALLHERNPRHLGGLASTFEPFFPLAAGYLRAKTMLLEQQAARNAFRLRADNEQAARQVVAVAGRLAGQRAPSLESMRVQPTSLDGPGEQLARMTERTTGWRDVAAMWRGLRSGNARAWFPSDRISSALATALGKPIAASLRTPIAELRSRVLRFAEQSGTPIEVINDEIRRAICLIMEAPYDAIDYDQRLPPPIKPHIPRVIVDLAEAVVKEIGLGVRCIDVERYAQAFPVIDGKEGFISPTALQLSLAAGKPEISGVSRIGRIPNLYRTLHEPQSANKGDVLRARAQMERANRAIERRRWVEWYRRARDANLLHQT